MKIQTLSLTTALFCVAGTIAATAQSTPAMPKAVPGYSISVFAKGANGDTAPDSLAIADNHVFVGYGDGNDPAGADGKSNHIVEYDKQGNRVYTYTVVGHNDGLKYDPVTGILVAIQNEDANPNVVVINPKTHQQTLYKFASAPPHGGGYDDIVFLNGRIYISASNPANNPNNAPAIVQATLVNGEIQVSQLLSGTATATNALTGAPVTLNLQDPDSMTEGPKGELVLDSQADSELLFISKPGTSQQSVVVLPLSSPYGTPQIDDTLFIPQSDGFMLLSDSPANTVYKISKNVFMPGLAYSAAVAGDTSQYGFLGRLDTEFGGITPVVTGLQSPHGLAFVPTKDDDNSAYEFLRDVCQELFPLQ